MHKIMIHPIITKIFPNNNESIFSRGYVTKLVVLIN